MIAIKCSAASPWFDAEVGPASGSISPPTPPCSCGDGWTSSASTSVTSFPPLTSTGPETSRNSGNISHGRRRARAGSSAAPEPLEGLENADYDLRTLFNGTLATAPTITLAALASLAVLAVLISVVRKLDRLERQQYQRRQIL